MKKVLLLALMGMFAISCNKKDDDDPTPIPPTPTTAKVMYTNACISAGVVKINVKDTPLAAATNLDYLKSSGYVNVNPGTGVKHSFMLQNSNLKLSEINQDLVVNNYYSVFAAGTVTVPTAVAIQDDLTAPATGSAKVRFINLSPDNLNETIYIGSSKVDSNIVFKGATGFRTVTAGSYTVIVQDPANVPQSKTITHQFDAGKIYTIMLTGIINGAGNAALTLTVLNNN